MSVLFGSEYYSLEDSITQLLQKKENPNEEGYYELPFMALHKDDLKMLRLKAEDIKKIDNLTDEQMEEIATKLSEALRQTFSEDLFTVWDNFNQ